VFGIDEHFESLYHMTLPDIDALGPGQYIACNFKDLNSGVNISNIHLYNRLMPFVYEYTADIPGQYYEVDVDMTTLRAMKSTSNAVFQEVKMVDDITKSYIISVVYGMLPLAKDDTVENYMRFDIGSYTLKSIVHKKKQKTDITVYHKFLFFPLRGGY